MRADEAACKSKPSSTEHLLQLTNAAARLDGGYATCFCEDEKVGTDTTFPG